MVKETLASLWTLCIQDAPGVLGRVLGATLIFTVLGLVLSFLFYYLVVRAGRLKLGVRWDGVLVVGWSLLVLLGTPLLAMASGLCVGSGWAASYLVKHERLGERGGKVVFKLMTATIASEQLHSHQDEAGKMETAKALLNGELKIPIKDLHKFSGHHLGEVSASTFERLIPIASDGIMHKGTAWLVDKTFSFCVYLVANEEGDLIYQTTEAIVRHDAETDGDGLVTVEEISDIACETHLDRILAKLAFHLMADAAVPLLLTMAALLVLPWPIMAGLAWLIRYRRGEPTDPPEAELLTE